MQSIKTFYRSNQADKHFSREEKVLGQFFTPGEVAKFMVAYGSEFVPQKHFLLDPACGDGVFLEAGLENGFRKVVGIEIDNKIKESLPDVLKNKVKIKNGLEKTDYEHKCDLVVGNPPFSAKYGKITDPKILDRFEMGRRRKSQALEILFLEKFIQCAKEKGVVGIILPMGIFANIPLFYVRRFILSNLQVLAIISLPRSIFRCNGKSTTSKTCILVGRKNGEGHNGKVFLNRIQKLENLWDIKKNGKFIDIEKDILYPEYYIDRLQMKSGIILSDIVKIKNGATEYGDKRIFSDSGIPFISAKVITPLGIDFSKDNKFVQPNSIMDKKNAYTEINDLVFVRVGVGCIGRASVIEDRASRGVADDWVYILKVRDKKISPYYLVFYLETEIIQKEIRKLSRGVGTITIPKQFLEKIPVVIDESLNTNAKNIYLKIVQARKSGEIDKAHQIRKEFLKKVQKTIKNFSI